MVVVVVVFLLVTQKKEKSDVQGKASSNCFLPIGRSIKNYAVGRCMAGDKRWLDVFLLVPCALLRRQKKKTEEKKT